MFHHTWTPEYGVSVQRSFAAGNPRLICSDRRCSSYTWVINIFIAYRGATYVRGFTVCVMILSIPLVNWHLLPCQMYIGFWSWWTLVLLRETWVLLDNHWFIVISSKYTFNSGEVTFKNIVVNMCVECLDIPYVITGPRSGPHGLGPFLHPHHYRS